MDFVAVLGDVFTAVLRFIRGAPPLPVQRHPREFMAFVRSHNVPVGVWSAYPTSPSSRSSARRLVSTLDLADIQGNILQGYRAANARHIAVTIPPGGDGRALLRDLLSPEAPRLSTAEEWEGRRPPDHLLNLGVTWPGLRALGVPDPALNTFPDAFKQGAAARARPRQTPTAFAALASATSARARQRAGSSEDRRPRKSTSCSACSPTSTTTRGASR